MHVKRLTALAAFALACFAGSSATATTVHPASTSLAAVTPLTGTLDAGPTAAATPVWATQLQLLPTLPSLTAAAQPPLADPAADTTPATVDNTVMDLRKALIALAMDLRDTRYVRGGRSPTAGFDCSGFVRYVFAHAVGMKLPTSSAAQFLAGLKVKRSDMKPGDLVFFKTGSKRHISHVGIYIANGRFIHSPSAGKTVQVSSLNDGYWARHFAGAKRPAGIVAAADNG